MMGRLYQDVPWGPASIDEVSAWGPGAVGSDVGLTRIYPDC